MADYDEDRTRFLAGRTELRIHGVGNTPPENLLRSDKPVLVAGTTTSGFYRKRQERPYDTWQLEAYSWGGLTSGGGLIEGIRKALWLLLLPFVAMNAAGWMMPRPAQDRRGLERRSRLLRWLLQYGWGQRLLRWLAQFATVGFALGIAAMSVDVIGLQCGSSKACTDANSWLQWLDTVSGRPGRLVAIALLAPVAVMVVLWFISRSSQRTSEGPLDGRDEDDEIAEARKRDRGRGGEDGYRQSDDWWEGADRMNIARPGLWLGAQRVRGLTRIHFGSAAAGVAFAYAATVVWLAREAGDFATFTAISGGWAIGVLVWGIALLARGGTPGVAGGEAPGKRPQTWWLLRAGLAVLLLAVLAGWLEGPTWAEVPDVSAIDARTTFNWAAIIVGSPVALILAGGGLALAVRGRWREEYGPAWMTAFLGAIVGVAFLATLALWVANTISSADAPIDVWPAYEAVVVAVLIVLAIALGRLAPHLWRLWKNSRDRCCNEQLDREFHADLVAAGATTEPYETWKDLPDREQGWLGDHESWVRSRLRERRIMQYTADRIVEIARWVTAAALVLWLWALFDVAVVLLTDDTGGFASVLAAWDPVVTLARWLLLLALGGVFSLVANSYSNADDRSRVAILWDVLTFWPRWFHPVTPPSYAATAVPQLVDHLDEGGPHGGCPVLIAAHSQGAVVALAAVARMSTQARSTVALLTFGNPARRLHGRFFSAYFGLPELEKARGLLTDKEQQVRWRNLTRCSDPIGGVVLVRPGDDPCRPCQPQKPRPPKDEPCPEVDVPVHGTIVESTAARRLANGVDWVMPDPYPQWPRRGDPLAGSKGHSNYDLDDPYARAREELFGFLPEPPRPCKPPLTPRR